MHRIYTAVFVLFTVCFYAQAADSLETKYQYDKNFIWEDVKSTPGWIWQTEKQLFKPEHLKYWGCAAAAAGLAYIFDDDFDRYLTKHQGFKQTAEKFSSYGTIAYSFTWAGFYLSGKMLGNEKLVRTGRDLIITQVSANIIGVLLWFSAGRQRPEYSENNHTFKPFDFNNLDAAIPPFVIQPSFPSLHTVGTTGIATVVTIHYGIKYGIPLYLFAGIVGYSRMALDGHYLSDVIGGAFLGTFTALAVTELMDKPALKNEHGEVSIVPYFNTHSRGIALNIAF